MLSPHLPNPDSGLRGFNLSDTQKNHLERIRLNLASLKKFECLGGDAIPLLEEIITLYSILKKEGIDAGNFLGEDVFNFPLVRSISEEAAKILSQLDSFDYQLKLNAITDLQPEAAFHLARAHGDLELNGLKHLSPESAKALSIRPYTLSLNGIEILERHLALVLLGNHTDVELNGVRHITPDAIPLLKKLSLDSLYLDGLEKLDTELAIAMYESDCSFSLMGVNEISRLQAEFLWPKISKFDFNEKTKKIIDAFNPEEGGFAEVAKVRQEGLPDLPKEAVDQIQPWVPFLTKNPNFKKVVLDSSSDLTTYLRQKGVTHPEVYQNLNAKSDIRPFLEEAASCLGDSFMLGLKSHFKRKNLVDFYEEPDLIEIQKDEIVQALADELLGLKSKLEEGQKKKMKLMAQDRATFLKDKINDPTLPERVKNRFRKQLGGLLSHETQDNENTLKKVSDLLDRLSTYHFIKPGKWGCRLASRTTHELTLGDECSDCTSASISGMNFWTVPVWLTDPGFNFMLQYDENGKLAHKFGMLWEETNKGEIILTIDSMELGNSQKKKAGMSEAPKNEEQEKEMVNSAIAFIREWAKSMGLDPQHIYASQYSNTGIKEFESFPSEKLMIAKIGQLDASEKILKASNPDASNKLKVYLQSLQDGAPEQEEDSEEDREANIDRGNAQADFREVEKTLQSFIDDASADPTDRETVRSILTLAKENPKDASRKLNVFLVMQAKAYTKAKLSVGGKRIDIYLNSRGHSLEKYLSAILGQVLLSKGQFKNASLRHLVEGPKKSTKRRGR